MSSQDRCQDVVSDLGMNCHIPNSFQVSLIVAHTFVCMYWTERNMFEYKPNALTRSLTHTRSYSHLNLTLITKCYLQHLNHNRNHDPNPNRIANTPSRQTATHAALHYAGRWDEGRTWAYPSQCLAACVRDALKQGGCCASRATFAGALLAAYLAPWAQRGVGSRGGSVPSEWERKGVEAARAKECAREICRIRRGSRARL